MAWDPIKAGEYFFDKYNRINIEKYQFKPKHEPFIGLHDIELASQRVYAECSGMAYSKDGLLTTLQHLIERSTPDEKAYDSKKYLAVLRSEATKLKELIESGELSFED